MIDDIIKAIPQEPYYRDDAGVIYNADCLDVLKHIPDGAIDLVLTDPPYGIDFNTDYRRFTGGYREGNNHDKVHGDDKPFDPTPFLKYERVVLWGGNCFSNKLPLGTWLIWDKRFKNGTAFLSDGEVAWMNKGHGTYIYSITSQGFTNPDGIRVHPTQKPVGLMRWCIEKAGDYPIILDPFLGSGTTAVAAKQLGRKYIGIEISEKYCEIAKQRLAQEELF